MGVYFAEVFTRCVVLRLLQYQVKFRQNPDGTIVDVETKRGADFFASLLSETEFPTTSIMAIDFKCDKIKVLIATSVAPRGLDIKNMKHGVNYHMALSIDEYVGDSVIAAELVNTLEGAGQGHTFLRNFSSEGGERDFNSQFGGRDVRKGVR